MTFQFNSVEKTTQKKLKSIYILEDDLIIRNIIQESLLGEGYDVKTFSDIKSLIKSLKEHKADLLIVDVNLPEGKYAGIQFLHHIREEIPYIIITGNDNIHTRTQSVLHGAKHYLSKPLNFKNLLQKVEKMIG